MKKCGVYKIQSICNPERVYIGSSIDIVDRWSRHRCDLFKKIHHSRKLQRHYNKYGVDDLTYMILELCTKENIVVREQHYLDTIIHYFNALHVARSCLGIKRSEVTKQKIREKRKFQTNTNKGMHWKLSEETKEKMKKRIPWNKGKSLSIEHRENLRISHLEQKIHHNQYTVNK
jgi:group I intron endonuclease